MGLREVSDILWRERVLLALLRADVEAEQRLHDAGRSRWLPRAATRVEDVLDALRTTQLARSVEVQSAAGALGLAPDVSLRELATAAPAPWPFILDEHRRAFLQEVHLQEAPSRAVQPSLLDFLR